MNPSRLSTLSGQHFVAASIAEPNEPAVAQCAIDLGQAGLLSNWTDEVKSLCPYPGISVEYFLWLASMLNFTFDVRTPTDGSYGKPLENGSWDGVIGMIGSGEADFSFHPLFMTAERAAIIDYGPFVYDRPLYGFLFKNPSKLAMFSAFYPFNWTIYTCVAAAFALALVFSFSCALLRPNRFRTKYQTFVEVVWSMLELDAGKLSGRFAVFTGVILFGWFIVAYNLANAYRSNLIMSAIGETHWLPINNLEDATRLLESNQMRLVVPKENRLEFYNVLEALPSISPDYEPWAKVLSTYEPTLAEDALEMARYLSIPTYAFFGDIRQVTWMFVKNPPDSAVVNLDVTFVKTAQSAATNSLGFRKNFPHKEIFDEAMMIMMSDVIIKQLTKKYFPDRYQNAGAAADFGDQDDQAVVTRHIVSEVKSLGFWQLLNLFWIWVIGCGLSILIFLLEICLTRFKETILADLKAWCCCCCFGTAAGQGEQDVGRERARDGV